MNKEVKSLPILKHYIKNIFTTEVAKTGDVEIDKVDLESLELEHLSYDSKINSNYDYQIIRSTTCDGSLYSLERLYSEIMELLINQESYCKGNAPEDLSTIKGCKYQIGDFNLETEHGDFGSKEKPWLQTEWTVSLPVKVEYVF
jgi:hypothetical protein